MMPDVRMPVSNAPDAARFVAESLPPTAAPPEPARRIFFPKALACYWLFPRQYGPHLAADSIVRALAAHLIAALWTAGVVVMALWLRAGGSQPKLHELRAAAARYILAQAVGSANTGWSWLSALAVLGVVPLLEVLLIALACLTMPWCAGGDRASSVWKRSVKNVYWSTTALLPGAVLFTSLYFATDWSEASRSIFLALPTSVDMVVLPLGTVAMLILFIRAVIVGAQQYVGPVDGPAFLPREPRCDDCGYILVGLPIDSRCPECGLAVRASLPSGRRGPNDWERYELSPRGFRELLRLQWEVLRHGPLTFRTLCVHGGLTAARHFWWTTYVLLVLVELVACKIAWLFVGPIDEGAGLSGVIAVTSVALPLILQAVMMITACLWAQRRYGIHDYRVSAVICYYASPYLWLVIAAWIVAFVATIGPLFSVLQSIPIQVDNTRMSGNSVAVGVAYFLSAASLFIWGRRLNEGLRSARFANA